MAKNIAREVAKKKRSKAPVSADSQLAKLYGAAGVNAGNAFTQKFLGPDSMGHVNQNLEGASENLSRFNKLRTDFAGPSATQQDVQQRLQAGLGGYSSPEMQAMREQNLRAQNSNLQTGLGQLAKSQARGKVYGAAASAQQGNLITANQNSANDLEQQLMIKNADEQQKRLGVYGQYANDLQSQGYDQQRGLTEAQSQEERLTRDEQFNRQQEEMKNQQALLASRISGFQGTAGVGLNKAQTAAAQRIQKAGINRLGGRV
jgi:hypothetical protein